MALTNAEKQARYRERHLENGTMTRGHFFLEATTKAKLLRLAHHRKCSVPALIGDLAASAERLLTAQLSGKASLLPRLCLTGQSRRSMSRRLEASPIRVRDLRLTSYQG
jgi:DNA-binding transcriptional ArsR family regulator